MSLKLKEKAGIYYLFSRLFHEAVNERLLREIVEKKMLTGVYSLYTEDEQSLDGDLLEEPEWITRAEDLAVEYTALFIISGAQAVCPYSSYYCDSVVIDTSTASSCYFPAEPIKDWGVKGLIGGQSTVSVNKIYLKEGYKIEEGSSKLPDHLAYELEFMGRMYDEGKAEAAENFFRNFLLPWVFIFIDKLKDQQRSNLYKKVALVLGKFLRYEFQDILNTQDRLPEQLRCQK